MNTSNFLIYGESDLDKFFIKDFNIKKIKSFVKLNDNTPELINIQNFNKNGILISETGMNNGWKGIPKNTISYNKIISTKYYIYKNGKINEIEEKNSEENLTQTQVFQYLPKQLIKNTYKVNNDNNLKLTQNEIQIFNNNDKLESNLNEDYSANTKSTILYKYLGNSNIIRNLEITLNLPDNSKAHNILKSSETIKLDKHGRAYNIVYEVKIDEYKNQIESRIRYLTQSSDKITKIEKLEGQNIIAETNFFYGKRNELIQTSINENNSNTIITFEYEGSD